MTTVRSCITILLTLRRISTSWHLDRPSKFSLTVTAVKRNLVHRQESTMSKSQISRGSVPEGPPANYGV
jgi:hypothetical protein